jgi:hypothetical protein
LEGGERVKVFSFVSLSEECGDENNLPQQFPHSL